MKKIIQKIQKWFWNLGTCNPPYDCPWCMDCYIKK